MIERTVYIKLNEANATDAGRAAVAQATHAALAAVPGVLSVRVGTPADGPSAKAWDLGLSLTFASLATLEAYWLEAAHRAFVDEYLAPRMECIKAWNWEIYAP